MSSIKLSASIDWRVNVSSLSNRTGSGYTLNKPLEHGRSADDTTFGVQLFADTSVAVHDVLERIVRAA